MSVTTVIGADIIALLNGKPFVARFIPINKNATGETSTPAPIAPHEGASE